MSNNNNIVITIPTRGRPDILKKRTLSFFEKSKDIHIVIEKQDFLNYKDFNKDYSVVILPENNKGLTYSRYYIQEFFYEQGYRYIWQLDDNIDQFIVRIGLTEGNNPRLRPIEEHNITANQILNETLDIMKKYKYAQMTLSFRPSNWYHTEDIKENTRSWGIVLNDCEQLNKNNIIYDLECKLFQDLEFVAQIFKNGLKNACYYKYAFHKKMSHYKGGCQDYRTMELSKNVCSYIKNKYGNLVSIKLNNKHELYEPNFKWKYLINDNTQKTNYNLTKYLKGI